MTVHSPLVTLAHSIRRRLHRLRTFQSTPEADKLVRDASDRMELLCQKPDDIEQIFRELAATTKPGRGNGRGDNVN